VLVFVDQDGRVRFDEPGRIVSYRRSRGQVIAVDHRSSQVSGQLAEQGALAHGARPVEDQHRLLGEPSFHDLAEPPHRQAGQYSTHGAILLRLFRDSDIYFPCLQRKISVYPACGRRNSLGRACSERD
jgi:hypothetical protein